MAQAQAKHKHKSRNKPKEDSLSDQKSNVKPDLHDRGSWWTETLKDTPIPGSYHIRDFLEEASLNPVGKTYGFKAKGREDMLQYVRKGDVLLPGAYNFTDSTQEALLRKTSYSFKNRPRPQNYTLGIRDKDLDLSPCHYDVMDKPVPETPCKNGIFRSKVKRVSFLPREGPAPGHYNPKSHPTNGITSCFKSTLPRLHSVRSRTPGPGTYEPSCLIGHRVGTETPMAPAHGLFFRSVL